MGEGNIDLERLLNSSQCKLDDSTKESLRNWLGESQRGCILIAAAFLDDKLEQLLRAHFSEQGASKRDCNFLLVKLPLPPIGSFAVRTVMASSLGLIDGNIRRALDELRAIRNRMAHTKDSVSLSESEVMRVVSCLSKSEQRFTKLVSSRIDGDQ